MGRSSADTQTPCGRKGSRGRRLVFPAASSLQGSPWEISEHALCPTQSLSPQGWLQWQSSYCVPYSSLNASPHPTPSTWELNQDSPLDLLLLHTDRLLTSRILLWLKGKASCYYQAPSTQRSPPVFSPFPRRSLMWGQLRAKWVWIAEYSESWPLLNHMLLFVYPNFFFDPFTAG